MQKTGIVYKYREYQDSKSGQNFTRDMLLTNEVYFPKPSELNDILDCEALVSYDFGSEKYAKWVLSNSELNDAEKCKHLIASAPHNIEKAKAVLKERWDGKNIFEDALRVYCVSSIWDSPQMWGNYANSNGICIGLKTHIGDNGNESLRFDENAFCLSEDMSLLKKEDGIYLPLWHIEYSDVPSPHYNPVETSNEDMQHIVFRKGKGWGYEQEKRTMLHSCYFKKDPIGIAQLAEGEICEIIFGEKVPDSIRKEIIQQLTDETITFYELTKDIHTRSITRRKIETKHCDE